MKRILVCIYPLLLLTACQKQKEADLPPPPDTVDQVFDRIACEPEEGMRFCEGSMETRVPSFDGVPLDVNVGFPPDSMASPPYPLIVRMHGYTGTKEGAYMGGTRGTEVYTTYTTEGFAVLTFSARGRGASCGSAASRKAAPEACEEGWDHLGDARRSIRDVQYLSGRLVDQGLVEPEIGVQGGSYGGGRSLLLATLRDRIQKPDGRYASWTSPQQGIEMEVGAAVPFIGWSDLTYGLAPNGRVLDYALGSDSLSRKPIGAYKHSITQGFWRKGKHHYNAPPGADPSINLEAWIKAFPTSGPITSTSRRAAREFTSHQSALGVPMTRTPAPTLIANGFTDDVFPVKQAVRWVNHVRVSHTDAEIAQLYGNFGHGRADQTSKSLLKPRALDWFKHYLQEAEDSVPTGVEAFVQSCEDGFGHRRQAETWRALSPGEVRFVDSTEAMVRSDAENAKISRQLDPFGGGSEAGSCRTVEQSLASGTATYTLPARQSGYTLMGAPTVITDLTVRAEENALLVARLWDVAPGGTARTLITRGIVRPRQAPADGESARLVFQLNANAYPIEPGHRVELQLLGRSTPYVRPPSTPFTITVESMDLRLPVAETPGTVPAIQAPAPRVLPTGMQWAPGYGDESR